MENAEIVRVEDLKEGDRVRLTFEGEWSSSRLLILGDSGRCLSEEFVRASQPTIHRLPPKARPLEKDEFVKIEDNPHHWLVIHVDLKCEQVWVAYNGEHRLVSIWEAYRPCGTPHTD